jgi:hypothetical protein
MSSVACIFQDGCRDNSTKESQLAGERDYLSTMRVKNPNIVVLNKRGKAPTNKAPPTNAIGRPEIPKSYITSQIRVLRQSGLLHNGTCKHEPNKVYSAIEMMWGNSNIASIKVETKIAATTVIAASSGYYLADGEMVYVHSDGSVCRMGLNRDVKCPCKSIHFQD